MSGSPGKRNVRKLIEGVKDYVKKGQRQVREDMRAADTKAAAEDIREAREKAKRSRANKPISPIGGQAYRVAKKTGRSSPTTTTGRTGGTTGKSSAPATSSGSSAKNKAPSRKLTANPVTTTKGKSVSFTPKLTKALGSAGKTPVVGKKDITKALATTPTKKTSKKKTSIGRAAPKAVAKKTTGSRGTKKSVTLLSPAQAKQRKDELIKKAVAAGRKKSTAKKKKSRLKPTKTGYASYKSFMGK